MFDDIWQVLVALWHQDFDVLLVAGSATLIYIIIASFVGLESAFLPAAPLPCDSVVVLAGTLSAVGVLNPVVTFSLLVACAAVGSWLAFLQGRWLNRLPRVQKWVDNVPAQNLKAVDTLLARHGLIALFCARFVPGARSLLPMAMGMRVESNRKFKRLAWISAMMWVSVLAGLGYLLPFLPDTLSRFVTMGLMAAPVLSLLAAVAAALVLRIKKLRRPPAISS